LARAVVSRRAERQVNAAPSNNEVHLVKAVFLTSILCSHGLNTVWRVFTGFVSSDECDGPWMPTPLKDARACFHHVASGLLQRIVQWSTPVRNVHFTTRP